MYTDNNIGNKNSRQNFKKERQRLRRKDFSQKGSEPYRMHAIRAHRRGDDNVTRHPLSSGNLPTPRSPVRRISVMTAFSSQRPMVGCVGRSAPTRHIRPISLRQQRHWCVLSVRSRPINLCRSVTPSDQAGFRKYRSLIPL